VQVPGLDLTGARIVWEGRDQQPAFGSTFTFTPVNNGDQWAEAEIEWPDGRRAFAENDFQANSPLQVWIDDALPAGANAASDGGDSWNWVSVNPTPESGSLAAFRPSVASGLHETSFTGASGNHAGLHRRHPVRLGLPEQRQSALGDPCGLERRLILGAPRVLGRQ
jgi:hypothetical protein